MDLKKKIASMKSRETRRNLDFLAERERELQQLVHNQQGRIPPNMEIHRVM